MSKPGKTLLQTFAGDLIAEKVDNVRLLYLGDIRPFGHQARQAFDDKQLKSLADSIKRHGLQQPITVRYNHDGKTSYELIAGERRWRACQLAGVDPIPAVLHDLDDRAAMEIHLAENLQRVDLNPIEEAQGYRAWLEQTGATQAELGKLVGKTQGAISNALRLLDLPQEVKDKIISGEMSAYHGRLLLSLKPGVAACNTYITGMGSVSGAVLPEIAPKLKPSQLEEAVRELNERASQEERRQREQLALAAKAEELAEKARAEGGGDVRIAPDSYRWPNGVEPIPAVATRRGNVHHQRCSQACPHPVQVARGTGYVQMGCGDAVCRQEVMAELEAIKQAAQAERASRTSSYRKAVKEGLNPADRRRLALYFIRTEVGGWKSDEDKVRIWNRLPAEVTEEDIIADLVHKAVTEAVALYDDNWGLPDHAAVRAWLADAFDIPTDWLLGEKPDEVKKKLADLAGGKETHGETEEDEEFPCCRMCARIWEPIHDEEDWPEEDLCIDCAEASALAEVTDGGQADGEEKPMEGGQAA